eukprot:6932454-Prymnesium_polylepis.3
MRPPHWQPGWHPGTRGRPAGPLLNHTPRLRAPPAEGRGQRGCRSRSASTHRPPTAAAGQLDTTQRVQQADQLVGRRHQALRHAAECTACSGVHRLLRPSRASGEIIIIGAR